jgi:hypothetical protein
VIDELLEVEDYLLSLVLDERIRLDQRIWTKDQHPLKAELYRRNDRARRAIIDMGDLR